MIRRASSISLCPGAVVVTLAATAFTPAWPVTLGAGAATVPVALQAGYSIGEAGRGDGQLNEPTDVAVDSANRLYVADSRNARI